MRTRTKAMCQNIHARHRFTQRLGLRLTQRLHDEIIHAIRVGRASVVLRQSHRVSLLDVQVTIREDEIVDNTVYKTAGPATIRVVYDHKRGTIATGLTPEMQGFALEEQADE
jgi:hypothetical protein